MILDYILFNIVIDGIKLERGLTNIPGEPDLYIPGEDVRTPLNPTSAFGKTIGWRATLCGYRVASMLIGKEWERPRKFETLPEYVNEKFDRLAPQLKAYIDTYESLVKK